MAPIEQRVVLCIAVFIAAMLVIWAFEERDARK